MSLTYEAPAASQLASAAALLTRFRAVRQATTDLCRPLSPEDMMVQSCTEASPVKWHLAHTSWFFETFVLRDFLPGYQPFHPDFLWLFNSYYNSLGDMPEKKLRVPPSRGLLWIDILAFRTHVDACHRDSAAPPTPPFNRRRAVGRITLGLEHEQQHLELIATDIKHALYHQPAAHPPLQRRRPGSPGRTHGAARLLGRPSAPGLIEAGITPDTTDLARSSPSITRHRVTSFMSQPFALASRLVTCAEYLAFIDENGYNRPELWLSEGWSTRARSRLGGTPLLARAIAPPNSGWSRLHAARQPSRSMTLSETPVCHLSFFEADAFARWSGCPPTHRVRVGVRRHLRSAYTSVILSASQRRRRTCVSLRQPPTYSKRKSSIPLPASRQSRTCSRSSATSGSGPQSPYTGYPGYRPLPRRARRVQRQVHERRRSSFAAAPASRRPLAHPRHLPKLLLHPPRAGSSPACASPRRSPVPPRTRTPSNPTPDRTSPANAASIASLARRFSSRKTPQSRPPATVNPGRRRRSPHAA